MQKILKFQLYSTISLNHYQFLVETSDCPDIDFCRYPGSQDPSFYYAPKNMLGFWLNDANRSDGWLSYIRWDGLWYSTRHHSPTVYQRPALT